MNTRSIGKKLKGYRVSHGWTLNQCSEQIGISARYLADIERGDKVPKLETFIRILNTLAASADDVLQDNLLVGHEAKANDLARKLDSLDAARKKQALDILDGVIASFHHHEAL